MSYTTLYYLALSLIYKHIWADYFLQTQYMVFGKRKTDFQWITPLASHASIHALGTFLAFLPLGVCSFGFGVLDFFLHSVIDKCKVIVEQYFAISYKSKGWWLLMLADQGLHFSCYILYVGVYLVWE